MVNSNTQSDQPVGQQQDPKRLTVVIRRTPYGSSLARAALDAGFAAAAFEQPVILLFIGDGVLQLISDQNSQAIGIKNIGRLLSSAPLYDIDTVYVDADALSRYNVSVEDLVVPAQALDEASIHDLLCTSDHLLGC